MTDTYDEEIVGGEVTEPMPGIFTVTVRTDEWLSSGTLEELITRRIADVISAGIRKEVENAVREKVFALVDERFEDEAKKALTGVIDGEISLTNQWGERTGGKTSLREHIAGKITKWLDTKVRGDGSVDQYGDKDSISRMERILRRIATEPLQDAVDEAVQNIADQARARIQENVSHYIAEQLMPHIEAPALENQ